MFTSDVPYPRICFSFATTQSPMEHGSLFGPPLLSVLKSEGKEGSDAYQKLYPSISAGAHGEFITEFAVGPDDLGGLEAVQAARIEILEGIFAEAIREMHYVYSPVDLGQHERGLVRSKAGVQLLLEAERLKLHIEVEYAERAQGSQTRLGDVTGIDELDAATIVNVQRLCVLLLLLAYKDGMSTLDHGALPYLDLEDSLRAKGLNDVSGVQFWSDEDETKWNGLLTQVEGLMHDRKAEELDVGGDDDARAWTLKGGMLTGPQVVLAVPRMQWGSAASPVDRCVEALPTDTSPDRVWLLVGQADSRAAEGIGARSRDQLGSACALIKAGLHVNAEFIPRVHDKRLRALSDAMVATCPSPLQDALVDAGPTLGFLDPGLSRVFLIQKHCEHRRS